MASIFTRIIRGELPCFKLYEDEHVISFLTLDAIAPGHALVVPKCEVDYFADVPEPYFGAVHRVSQPITKAIQEVTGCRRVATAVIGLEVPHFHLHLVPIQSIGDLDFRRAKRLPAEESKALQEKIMAVLPKWVAAREGSS